MHSRIETALKTHLPDPLGHKVQSGIKHDLGIDIPEIRTVKSLTLLGEFNPSEIEKVAKDLFHDPIVEHLSFDKTLSYKDLHPDYTHAIEVSFAPGVTDNVARSAHEAIELLLDRDLNENDHVYSGIVYLINAANLDEHQLEKIQQEVLHNELIEQISSLKAGEIEAGKTFPEFTAPPQIETPEMEYIELLDSSDEELLKLSKDMGLALTLEEMKAIQDFYKQNDIKSIRKDRGLNPNPTDVELEVYAQTWSEHCKHKIFAANVEYTDENGNSENIRSLFKTMIHGPTYEIMKKRDDISSVFSDNAGAFHFDEDYDICIKAETHNSPSALDPYGGAMTGIVGVNRDVMGTGRGFLPIFNTDIFCFGPPNHSEELPGKLHHPKRIFRGVHRGVKDGGNESGIPTVNGSISFDKRFIGKPLVFCGTGGIAPRDLGEKPIVEKWITPGDKIIMLGGRIGKDGIHGATFSSEGLSSSSPTSAVQIGDPITQKRMTDFLIVARDKQLYGFITDNGAGGLSSSLGEMATECGGANIDLSLAPLKYPGLAPWEIFLSEAQERMSLAVPPANLDEFLELARSMKVLATCLGEFTDSGYLDISYGEQRVALLDMEFLHEGLPTLELKATWKLPAEPELEDQKLPELNEELATSILSRFNICSKEDWVRQYDHEVQGMSVIKPFCGSEADGPSDAAVIRPSLKSFKGLAVSHGLLPRYSDVDAYHMVANCIDEAVRSVVCVGADPKTATGLDNFCWPDPVQTPSNPEGEYKMAQLVRANQALRDYALAYNIPCISGKDSMKNDYVSGDLRISIPPTLLYTCLAITPDCRKSVSMDFKQSGDLIYLLGETKDECGGSEFYDQLGLRGSNVPVVDATSAMERYNTLYLAIHQGIIRSAHDCSEGGLFVTLSESCLAGRLGCDIEVNSSLHKVRYLFSESASRILISVRKDDEEKLKQLFAGQSIERLGEVKESYNLSIDQQSFDLDNLYRAWRTPLGEKNET